jgi:serine/threonine protein kinase
MTETPKKIGKYEIVKEIGKGSMGTVYSANDPFSDRLVAIKVAHPQFIDKSEQGQRFRKLFFNEAHAAGVLDHPNILRIFDADADGELCYLVMECIPDARTLDEHVQPETLMPLRQVVNLIYKCAKALDYAHRQGIIHRDIKPSNLLLTDENDIKLADFSIAMINRQDTTSTQFTGFLGSPLYMSPEQINEQPLDNSTDIFSLGSLMYQLLTGRHPFKADTLAAISQRITKEEPPPVTDFRDDLPEGLSYTVKRMLKKKPTQRYSMGLDLAADLAVIFEDLDTVTSEDSLREKFGTIKNLGFFKGFSDSDIWELIRACTWQNYPALLLHRAFGRRQHREKRPHRGQPAGG